MSNNNYCNMLREIISLSKHDKERLMQCLKCANNSDKCGCTEKDEDVNGMCLKYKERRTINE